MRTARSDCDRLCLPVC